jgi:hypothetical protein
VPCSMFFYHLQHYYSLNNVEKISELSASVNKKNLNYFGWLGSKNMTGTCRAYCRLSNPSQVSYGSVSQLIKVLDWSNAFMYEQTW